MIDQIPEQSITPAQIPPQETRHNKTILVLFAVVVILGLTLIISTFFFLSKNKKTELVKDETISPTVAQSRTIQKSVSDFIPNPITNWNAPAKYLTYDGNGGLVLGVLDSSKTYLLAAKYPSKYFGFTDPKFSKDGKYATYLALPKSVLDEFEKNPPYEFHGSSDYELHLVDISNPESTTDTLIATSVNYGLGAAYSVEWKTNNTLVYEKWNKEESKQEYYLYNIDSKSVTNTGEDNNDWIAISPSGKYYSVLGESSKAQTNPNSISGYKNLLVGEVATGKEQLVYENFLMSEADSVFIDDDHLILTREDFARQTISDCYVELVTISERTIEELDKVECPPGSSYTNIFDPTISPDGKYLAALYSQDPPNKEVTERIIAGSGYLYNFTTHEKKFVAKNEHWYGNVVWLSSDEVLFYTSGSHGGTDPKEALIYNLKTDKTTPHPTLNGKEILGIF